MVASATSGSCRPPPGALSALCDNHPSGVATRRPGPLPRQATTIGPLSRLRQKAFAPSQTTWSIEYLPARTRIRKSRSGRGRVIVPSARSSVHSSTAAARRQWRPARRIQIFLRSPDVAPLAAPFASSHPLSVGRRRIPRTVSQNIGQEKHACGAQLSPG
jgi:hypothetical protein